MARIAAELTDEVVDAVVVAALRRSVTTCVSPAFNTPEDRAYARRYREAANFVILHFGGKRVTEAQTRKEKITA